MDAGGMSRLFLATDRRLNRPVVVKVLPDHLTNEGARERFEQEILVSAGLQHPHIVPVLSAGEAAGRPYFIMPLVEGESLRQRLERGPLSLRETVTILQDVARALAYAHERGIVHRDLKPDNILLSPEGSATLTDFGVAKARGATQQARSRDGPNPATLSGMALGTPAYMAPEQAAGGSEIDRRADIYTLGITAYEMLEGHPPFHDRPAAALIAAQITEPAPALTRKDVPRPLAALVAECLAKDPADRPQSAADVLARFEDPGLWSGEFSAQSPSWARRHRFDIVALGAVLGLAGLLGAGVGVARWNARRIAANRRSIVVLPLVDVSHDTAGAYFAAGMTDQLTGALDQVPDLRVASPTAASVFRGRDVTPQQIGRALDVATLLEGTIERSGDSIRLDVSLVSARSGLDLWSGMYPARLRDVFAVQDSLTAAIVGALRQHFGGAGAAPASAGQRTQDVAALDDYLRGRYALSRRGQASLHQAIDFFNSAVQRDAGYAAAYTGLADAYGLLSLYSAAPADSVIRLGLQAADRAIAIDSTVGPAYASRANLETAMRRWDEAERDFRKAVALDPDYAVAHQWYGELLAVEGRVGEAVRELREARRLDPISPLIAASYGVVLGTVGDYAQAIQEGRRAVGLDPALSVTHLLLGRVHVDAGHLTRALDQLEIANRLQPGIPATEGALGYAYGASWHPVQARKLLADLLMRADPDRVGLAVARVYLGLGNLDSALVWLRRGAEHGDPGFSSQSLASPMFDPVRGDRRFAAVLRTLHLDPKKLAG
jgi:TolB-like protein/Flp pilus assembly protein TadD